VVDFVIKAPAGVKRKAASGDLVEIHGDGVVVAEVFFLKVEYL